MDDLKQIQTIVNGLIQLESMCNQCALIKTFASEDKQIQNACLIISKNLNVNRVQAIETLKSLVNTL